MPYTLVPDLPNRSRQVVLDGSRRVITHKSPYVAKDEAELLRCAQSSRGLRIQELGMTTAQFMERVEAQEAAEKLAKETAPPKAPKEPKEPKVPKEPKETETPSGTHSTE